MSGGQAVMWRTYCPEHDTDHLEAGRCPVDNVTMEIAEQLELALESEVTA